MNFTQSAGKANLHVPGILILKCYENQAVSDRTTRDGIDPWRGRILKCRETRPPRSGCYGEANCLAA